MEYFSSLLGHTLAAPTISAKSLRIGTCAIAVAGQVLPEQAVALSEIIPAGPVFQSTVIELSVLPPPPVMVPLGEIVQL